MLTKILCSHSRTSIGCRTLWYEHPKRWVDRCPVGPRGLFVWNQNQEVRTLYLHPKGARIPPVKLNPRTNHGVRTLYLHLRGALTPQIHPRTTVWQFWRNRLGLTVSRFPTQSWKLWVIRSICPAQSDCTDDTSVGLGLNNGKQGPALFPRVGRTTHDNSTR